MREVRAMKCLCGNEIEAVIQRSLEEREALEMELSGRQPEIAEYWRLPEAQRRMIREEQER